MREMIDVKEGEVNANLGNLFRPFFKPYSKSLKKISRFKREDS